MGITPINDGGIWELLSEGDEMAFTHIYGHYAPQVYTSVCRILKDSMLAEELVQDVFLKLWQQRLQLMSIANPTAYLYTLAKNMTVDRLRSKAYNITRQSTELDAAMQELADYQQDGFGKLVAKEKIHEWNKVLSCLTAQQRQIFQLAKMEGMSYKEIAAQLSISELTVKKHMVLLMKRIKANSQHII